MIAISYIIFGLFLMVVYLYHRLSKQELVRIQKDVIAREDNLNEHIINYNKVIKNFNDYYKNKTYQAGLSFLQLKKYQQDLIDILDSELDKTMIHQLELSNAQLENILRELSFLSNHDILFERGNNNSMIEKIYFDNSKFSKN